MSRRSIGFALAFTLVLVVSCSVDSSRQAAGALTFGQRTAVAVAGALPTAGAAGAIPPDEFPTMAGIDFAAFPVRVSLPPSPAPGGRVIHVEVGATGGNGTEGSPFGSPVRAVRAATSGDVVLVGDGTYRVSDRRCGCALALWVDGVTLAAEHARSVTLVPGRNVVDGLQLRGEHLAVVGIRLRGFRDALTLGEEQHPVSDVVLQGLVLRGSGILMGLAESSNPAQPPVDGLLIADTRIIGGHHQVIGINCAQGPCDDVRVSGVTVTLTPSGSSNSGMDTIGFESGDNVVVEATDVTGADADGIDLKASHAAVVNCYVHAMGRNGVKLWRGGDIINTIIVNTAADAAVVFKHPADYRILHSIVTRHIPDERAYTATVSYDDRGAGSLQVVNSIFYDNSGALWISADYDVDIRNSIFFRSFTGGLVEWGDVLVEEGQGFGALEAAGGGSDDREVDPGFVDAANNDFHLASGSPGLGAGTTAVDHYPKFDFAGQARGTNGAPNIGPYESG